MDLRELRKEKGWSQGDLSNFTGLSVKTIHRIENGHGTPSAESAKALAAVFDLPFADFLPPAKESTPLGQKEREQQASNANPSPELVSTFASSWRAWVPYIAASFVAVSAYLINDLYSQIGQLSEGQSQLAEAQAQIPDSDVDWLESYNQTRTSMVAAIDEFTGYYGDQAIPSLLADQQSDALNRMSRSVKEIDSGFLRRMLGGSN